MQEPRLGMLWERWLWLRRPRMHGRPTPCWTFTPSPPPPPSQGELLMKIFFQYLVFNMGLGHLHMTLCPHLRPAKSPSPSRSPTSLSISRYIIVSGWDLWSYHTCISLFTSNHCLGTLASPPSLLSHEILGILPISTEKPTRGVHITRFKVSMNGSKPWCLGWSHNIYLAE